MPLPLLDFDPASKWFVIILAMLTIIYAVMRPWLRKRDPLSKPPSFGSLAQQRSVERQMQNVLVEMSEMARQITAQLDTRAAKLEALIREADEKITAMKSAATTQAPAQPFTAAVSAPPPPDPRHAQVYALADQGRSSREIAQQLNRPSGEIELILALRS
jgi:flagellar biosynthesis/type III secretory pathway M-ring protein FliF/YscJ